MTTKELNKEYKRLKMLERIYISYIILLLLGLIIVSFSIK